MADKFIIQGATYYGDGTTSAEATVDGGVGAWNNINILTGTTPTYGTLAAGDVVYIRSKTSAGADVTVQLADNTQAYIGRNGGGVTWIVDAGEKWSGISGRLTLRSGAYNSMPHFLTRAGNVFRGTNRNLYFESKVGDAYRGYILNSSLAGDGVVVASAVFDNTMGTNGTFSPGLLHVQQTCNFTAEDCLFKSRRVDDMIRFDDYNNNYSLFFIGCDFELTADKANSPSRPWMILAQSVGGGELVFVGGRVYGADAIQGREVVRFENTRGCYIEAQGLIFPRVMTFVGNRASALGAVTASSGSDGVSNIQSMTRAGDCDSRTDGFYPYLNGVRPDGTPFSLKVYPRFATNSMPLRLPVMSKFYTNTQATRTITVEALVNAAASPAIAKNDLWFVVTYTDPDGVPRHESTYAPSGALDTSTAGWSSTSYGPVGYNKRKMSLTTDYSIKADSVIYVSVFMARISLNSDDVSFIDPDFTVT